MASEDVTVGELDRRMARWERSVANEFAEVKAMIAGLRYVQPEVYALDISNIREQVKALDAGLSTEQQARATAEKEARAAAQSAAAALDSRRAQVRVSAAMAVAGVPLSVLAGVVTARILGG